MFCKAVPCLITEISAVWEGGERMYKGGDEIPAGTFHGGDEIPAARSTELIRGAARRKGLEPLGAEWRAASYEIVRASGSPSVKAELLIVRHPWHSTERS